MVSILNDTYGVTGTAPFVGDTVEGVGHEQVAGKLYRVERTGPKNATCTGEDGRSVRIPYGLIKPTSRQFAMQVQEVPYQPLGSVVTVPQGIGKPSWTYRPDQRFAVIKDKGTHLTIAKLGGEMQAGSDVAWNVLRNRIVPVPADQL
jgi:hypothetical protein